MSTLSSPASLLQRLRVTRKFAALGCVVLITVLLLLYSLIGTLNGRIDATHKELTGGKATLAIMKLIQAAQQHRGLSSMLIVGESQLAEKRAAKQAEVDALFKDVDGALPASNHNSAHWKKITADWADIQSDGLDWTGAQSFNAHTGLISDLLDLQISVADDSGLVLDPDAGSHYLIETGVIKLPLLLERLGRLRGKGATALTQQKTPPQTRVDFSVLDVEINSLLRETESDIKKVVRHAPALEAPLGIAIQTMHEVTDQVLQIVAADILHEQFKMPPADYFALTSSAIDAGYKQLYENIYPSLNQLLYARIEAAQTGRKLSVAACMIVFAVLFYLMIADVTARKRAEDSLKEFNTKLEHTVEERTEALQQALKDLGNVIENLEQTQDELVRSEKLAALGSMVAGVAHELNTPIGNSLMVASHLVETSKKMKESLKTGLKKSILDEFLDNTDTTGDVLVRNLSKAAELISSFKQVAVDQTSSQRRSFNLAEMLAEVVTSLGPTIRMTPYVIEQKVVAGISMDSFPGPLGQVVSNLINNGIIHGFDGREHGHICIEAAKSDDGSQVVLKISDDGKGIPTSVLPRIFDPFFTTKLGQGGSGLGLNIVHNMVFGILGGRISAESTPGEGSCFTLALPLSAPQQDTHQSKPA